MRIMILSGVPGSGKSMFVESVTKDNPTARVLVCSADSYFMSEGEYKFDPSKLGEAHGLCLRTYASALAERGINWTLIVDNTNTTVLELAPYVALANAYGITPELVTLRCDAETAFKRNVHGVPLAGIERMAKALADRKIPPYWNLKQV